MNSEQAFLDWLAQQGGAAQDVLMGIGDDAAVLQWAGGDLVITTDMLLDGTHFDTSEHDPASIGHKAIACSLSDLAAMAARPVCAVVSAALPRGSGIDLAKRLHAGMQATAERFGCPIVGGDTTSWDQGLALSVAMIGRCPAGRPPILRSGAKDGDIVCVTGPLGGSLLGKHLTFEPRVALAERLATELDVHAMMDISDGLALDLSRVCAASGTGAILEERLLEGVISDAAREIAADVGDSPLLHALHDGEDFELLVVLPAQEMPQELADQLHRVGVIVPSGLSLRRVDDSFETLKPSGYEHGL